MNAQLLHRFTKEEVHETLMQMGPLKSLDPEGFGACFYQKHQNIIGDEVSSTVVIILQRVGMTSCFNSIYIALILKKCNLLVVIDFGLINLYNVIYKLVSKVLTN